MSAELESDGFRSQKRKSYLEWNEYFMAVAFLSAKRSKDPHTQVGACIVNTERKIVGIGYNGMPNGCSDDVLPWARKADTLLDTKYPYGRYVRLFFVVLSIYAGADSGFSNGVFCDVTKVRISHASRYKLAI